MKIEANGNRVHNAPSACRGALKLFNPLKRIVFAFALIAVCFSEGSFLNFN